MGSGDPSNIQMSFSEIFSLAARAQEQSQQQNQDQESRVQSPGSTPIRISRNRSNVEPIELQRALVASGLVARWERYWGNHRCS